MEWIQLKDANWKIPYVGGWCEGYVEGAWGQATFPTQSNQTTSGVWGSAIAKWNANPGNGNHPGELPPKGKTVAVYFSLGNVPQGHTAISLDDGMVASTTQSGFHSQGYLHPNLQDLINLYGRYNGGCTYLGWSEYVGNIRVISPSVVKATDDEIRQAYLDILERPADDGALVHYRNYTNDFVRNDLLSSNERKALIARKAFDAAKAISDKAEADAKALKDAKDEADRLASEKEALKLKAEREAKEAQALKDAQLADEKAREDAKDKSDSEFIARLKKLIDAIVKFFTDLKG